MLLLAGRLSASRVSCVAHWTVLLRALFITAIGCSGPPPTSPVNLSRGLEARVNLDAHSREVIVTPDAAPPSALGAACTGEQQCGADHRCLPMPGGYCASACGVTGAPCDGACVETPGSGELCLASCSSDAECRTTEGYTCDRQWRACMIPNTAAIVPRECGQLPGIGRDPAFAPTTALSTAASPGSFQLEPSTVVTDDGALVALYLTRGAITDGNVLGLAKLDTVGRTALDLPFATGRANNFDPWLARDAKGKLYAVWLAFDARDATQEIAMSMSSDRGQTWSPPVAVHEPGDCAEGEADCLGRPMVVVGPDPLRRGKEIVYVAYAAGGLRVRASRDGGATFGPARTPIAGARGDLAVGADGLLYVVALNGGPGGAFGSADHVIEFVASGDGGARFTTPRRLSRHGEMLPFYFSNPSVVVDDRRRWIYVAYTRGGRDGKWDLVIVASKDKGKTWTRARIGDDPPCAIHMVPNLALDPTTGQLHVAWYDSHGPRFAHAVCVQGAATCRQVGRINDVPFAALSTVRHGAKWVGEYQSLVVDPARRTLHATWTQPVDDGGKIVSRIFHAKAKLPPK